MRRTDDGKMCDKGDTGEMDGEMEKEKRRWKEFIFPDIRIKGGENGLGAVGVTVGAEKRKGGAEKKEEKEVEDMRRRRTKRKE